MIRVLKFKISRVLNKPINFQDGKNLIVRPQPRIDNSLAQSDHNNCKMCTQKTQLPIYV